jgi:hypothetical protein
MTGGILMNTIPDPIPVVASDATIRQVPGWLFERLVRFGLVELGPRGERWQISWNGRLFLEQLRREEEEA